MNMESLFPIDYSKENRMIRREDLKKIHNLKRIFSSFRDYFAGNVTGITRDETIAANLMRILLCKVHDEKNSKEFVEFNYRPNENADQFRKRIIALFDQVKSKYSLLFSKDEIIEIGANDLKYIVEQLEDYSITDTDRDVIGDAFEELISTSFRGGEGQFFTPRNVVQMMVEALQPKSTDMIIDPACGTGGFLAFTLRYLSKTGVSQDNVFGIDKDAFLVKIARIYLSLLGDQDYKVFCENSLDNLTKWQPSTRTDIKLGSFDIVITNPPFGSKIPVIGKDILSQYSLGHVWKVVNSKPLMTSELLPRQSPQVLFIERCIDLLKDGGKLGIILPEGIFGNPSDRFVWEYINQKCGVMGIVSLAQETFQPSTHTKTSILFLQKGNRKENGIFMAIANKVGHNKNGKAIYRESINGELELDDELPIITENIKRYFNHGEIEEGHLGFKISKDGIQDNIYIPDYYNPEIIRQLEVLKTSGRFDLVSIGQLIKEKVISIKRGNEIGSEYYGTGEIPFVRTSDIVNWEIKADPVKSVAEEIFLKYKKRQNIRENDILLVNDGTFLIGRTAMVTKNDLRIVVQSHIRIINILDDKRMSPYYLFYLLNTKIVRKQIDSKTFVQATISTLGNRLEEVVLPIHKENKCIEEISHRIRELILKKQQLKEMAQEIMSYDNL